MRIATGSTPTAAAPLKRVEIEEAPAAGAPAAAEAAPLQSAVLQPALEALRALPDFDQARVDALRAALAKGELPFDPARLAGLIQRFHGNEA